MKKIEKQRREKRKKYQKELKRFDLILKEIFSKAVSIIFWLATGQKIEGKAKVLPAEIRKGEKEIAKYIDSVSFLAGLFDIKIEVKPMSIEVDIKETFLYKWGEKEGKQEGLKEGLKKAIFLDIEEKFGISKANQIKKTFR